MKPISWIVSLSLCLIFAASSFAQNPRRRSEENEAKPDDKKSIAELVDKISKTEHTTTLNDKEIKYTATAGSLVMKDGDDKAKATIFFIAYTKNGVDDLSQRPITFVFNGGPGSSSVWLHLGMLGPKRIRMTDDASPMPPPYKLSNNPHSLLDLTDLVFIDPVSTGFSRAAQGEEENQFHGYEEDLRSVGQFIHDYVTKYGRWLSPKFVLGESYGGFRAAGLSGHLRERYNMPLNGVIMISPAVNFQTLSFAPGNDLPYILYIPTYAATAWYHKALPGDLQKLSLDEVVQQATEFANNDYSLAMMKGQTLSDDDRDAIAEQLARLTGLSKEYVLNSNLRVSIQRFAKELLRDRGKTVGRYDSRYTGIDADSAGEGPEYDPSGVQIFGPFTATINDYLRNELKVDDVRVYEILTGVGPWNYGRFSRGFPDTTNTLRQSMSALPFMKLFVAAGHYDMATPPATSKYAVDHMRLPSELLDNITYKVYEGGHMMYVYEPSMKELRKDLEKFYASALDHDDSDESK